MKKVALVAFGGEQGCAAHALLNAVDMRNKGYDVALIIEGAATKALAEMTKPESSFYSLYCEVRDADLVDCVCQACAWQHGVLPVIEQEGLALGTDLKGHPSLARYLEDGFTIITF